MAGRFVNRPYGRTLMELFTNVGAIHKLPYLPLLQKNHIAHGFPCPVPSVMDNAKLNSLNLGDFQRFASLYLRNNLKTY